MVNSYQACSSVLSTFLLVIAIFEIMITLFPLYSAPVLLRFTGTHLAAVCGFITGLVILPNSIRLKFNESSPESERLHGHTSYLKKITLFVSLCLNAITLLVTIVVLIIVRKKDHAHNFLRLMKAYHSSVPARVLVNWIQLTFECCGALTYKDWLSINWRMYEVSNDEDSVEEENSAAVPYSCCNKTAAMSCGHYDLRTYGTCSIYTAGCGRSLKLIAVHYIWILLVLYVISIALQLLLWATYSACRPEKVSSKEDYIMEETTEDIIAQYAMVDGWRGTSNCSKSSYNSGASSDVSSDGDEITSSHKQVRIFSSIGKSRHHFRVLPQELED